MRRWLPLLALCGACTSSIHQVQVSDFTPYAPKGNARMVEGFAEERVILFSTESGGEVRRAFEKLQQECGLGYITAITVETRTRLGFFNWTNEARFRGLCVVPETPIPGPEDPVEGEGEDAGESPEGTAPPAE